MKKHRLVLILSLFFVFAVAFAPSALAAPPGRTIVDVAIEINTEGPFAGQFDTFIAAVLAAHPVVLETLYGNGQFTVFAPTDDAFAALGLDETNIGTALSQEVVSSLAFLTDILLYHVARGHRYADKGSKRIRTLYGEFLFQKDGVLTDYLGREANIIVTDVEAANGIIHAIDAVVLPFAHNLAIPYYEYRKKVKDEKKKEKIQ